jgi:hypothetical protein
MPRTSKNMLYGSSLVPRSAVFSIGVALSRSRDLLRRLLREHAPDDARRELAERVVKELEGSGFELDEERQALRKRPPLAPHGMARGQ